MRRVAVALAGASALACSGLGGPDLDALRIVADVAETVDAADRGALLLGGLAEPGVGLVSDACAEKLREGLVAKDPAARSSAYAEAFSGLCPATCAQDVLADLATMDPTARGAAVLQACDAQGPDLVFGGADVAALRGEIDPIDYLVARMLLEPTVPATAGTPLGDRYALLSRDTAISLAARGTPRTTADKSEILATPNLRPELATITALASCRSGFARLVTDAQGHPLVTVGGGSDSGCVATTLTGLRFPATSDGGYAVVDVGWAGGSDVDLLSRLADAELAGLFAPIGEPGVEGFGGLGGLRDGTDGGVVPVEAERPSPSVSTAPVELEGALSKEIVSRTMKRYVVQVRYCYEKLLTVDPNAAGKLDLELTIGSDGAVTTSRAKSDTLGSTMTECVAEKARKWEFPAPENGGTVQVKYPFTFTPS